jgi:hypothetical protein
MDKQHQGVEDMAARKRQKTAFMSGKEFKPANDKEKTLSEIFQPPNDIMTPGTFDSVKEQATEEMKWMLVNIQQDSHFPCHILNRDFWSDDSIKAMVQCSFLLWQQLDSSQGGAGFIDQYQITARQVWLYRGGASLLHLTLHHHSHTPHSTLHTHSPLTLHHHTSSTLFINTLTLHSLSTTLFCSYSTPTSPSSTPEPAASCGDTTGTSKAPRYWARR